MNSFQLGWAGAVPELTATLKLGKARNRTMFRNNVTARVFPTALAALLALSFGTAHANIISAWTDGSSSWGTSGNWSAGVPGSAGDTADFQGFFSSGNRIVTLDGDRTIGILKLGFTANGRGLTLNAGTPSTSKLILDNGGSNAQINFQSGGGNAGINPAVELRSNLLITNDDAGGNKGFFFVGTGGISSTNGNLTITNTSNANSRTKFNSVISDGTAGNSITFKQTSGWVEFTAANTFTGTTTNGGGLLHLGNTAGISLALQNSALDTTASIAGDASNGLRLYTGITSLTLGGLIGNKNFAAAGGVFSTASANYNLVTALTLNPGTGKSYSYDGAIENGAANMTLTKTGAGTQTLNGTSTYSGDTLVSVGTLLVNGSLTSSTNDVTVSNLATIGGSGSIAGTLSFGGNSFFDVFLADPLAVGGTVSFIGSGFGIDNLTGINWDTVLPGAHTILTSNQDFSSAGLDNWGSGNAVPVGTLGRTAYFQNEGSLQGLQVMVAQVPEPTTLALLAAGLAGLLAAAWRLRKNN